MQSIYSLSCSVTIWLGDLRESAIDETADNASLSEADIRSAFGYFRGLLRRRETARPDQFYGLFERLVEIEGYLPLRLLRSILRLLRRPWFIRILVLQEQIATQSSRFLCGD